MNTTRFQDGDSSSSYLGRFARRRGLGGATVARIGSMALGAALCVAAQAQRTATGTATVINGIVVAVTVTDPGEGYVNPPTVTLSGGGGSGATATASLSGSGVGAITVTAAGSGYATGPEVVIGPPDVLSLSILDLRMIPEITIYGEIGTTNQIQWANAFGDTNAWNVLTNITLPRTPFVFYDTISPRGSHRFYRAVVGGVRPAAPAGFVWLHPGRFTMGSPSTEPGRFGDEGPQTIVTLSRGLFMGSHEVTQAEYQAVVGANPSHFTGDGDRPVERVSWYDAVDYCVRLTEQERTSGRLPSGWAYRLPTETEWEYAARAGRTNRFSFGDDPSYSLLGEYAWYGGNSGNRTHAVAGKRPNSWGLYDMSGNVWEWCSDWFGSYPGGTVTDPQGASAGSSRVNRGGGWYIAGSYCRSAQRYGGVPGYRDYNLGFRAVLAPVVVGPPDVLSLSILNLKRIPEITIYGEVGATNQIQWANAVGDTYDWTALTNIVLPSDRYVFYDTISPNGSQRFYRAVMEGGGALPSAPPGFVWLPPGRFTMGSPSTEQDRTDNEGPQTIVTLSRGFFMGAHEVTQGEYQAVVGFDPSYFSGYDNRQVEQVTWNEAMNYCVQLTEQERTAGRLPFGMAYRLPTEAEWEYAVRCGRPERFSFGDDPGYNLLDEYAWFTRNSGDATHAVPSKRANRWGLHDMNGNVWEWCLDRYGGYPGGSVTDPQGAPTGSTRVVRGGSWVNAGNFCRSAQRGTSVPDSRRYNIGFRAVLAQDH